MITQALVSKNSASFNEFGIFVSICPSHLIGNIAVNNADTNMMLPPFGGSTAVDNNIGTP